MLAQPMETNEERMEVDAVVSPNAEYDEAIRLFKTSNIFFFFFCDNFTT